MLIQHEYPVEDRDKDEDRSHKYKSEAPVLWHHQDV